MEENSLTGNPVETTGAQMSPTGEGLQQQPAEQSTQDTNSGANTQGSVSDDTATQQQAEQQTQTQQTGGDSQTDDGLAKFAQSQGFDLSTAGDDVKRALKIAHDNQKAFRNSNTGKSITDTAKDLDDDSLQAEVAQLRYERETDRFWSGENRDKSLEPSMVEILNEAAEKHGKEYAFTLSRDLDTLYGLAQLRNGASSNVDTEAIRREERESIRHQSTASDTAAHASTGHQPQAQQITEEWLANGYDSTDPKQRAMVDAYFAGQQ